MSYATDQTPTSHEVQEEIAQKLRVLAAMQQESNELQARQAELLNTSNLIAYYNAIKQGVEGLSKRHLVSELEHLIERKLGL